MDESDMGRLIHELIKNGDIKFYLDDGNLVSLSREIECAGSSQEDADNVDYIGSVERDFRSNAGNILEMLDLSHLNVRPKKKAY